VRSHTEAPPRRWLLMLLSAALATSLAWVPCAHAQFPAGRARVTRARPAPTAKEPGRRSGSDVTSELDESNLPDTPAVRLVRSRLAAARAERAQASTFFPWLTLIVGGGLTLGAGIASAVNVLRCPATCEPVNFALFALVGGAALTTLGAIWTIEAEHGLRELDSHQYQLEQELERVRLSRLSRDVLPTRAGSLVSLRFAL
jgi:hypothetical protein